MAKNQTPLLVSTTTREKASDRPLKAKNSNLYYKNSYIKCYYFCHQCENYFKTAGANGHKHILFATSFLKRKIFFC